MKSPKNKTEKKEMDDSAKKAKGAEPENSTSAKDAKKIPVKKEKD